MQKNFDKSKLQSLMKKTNIQQYFDNSDICFFVITYQKGEFLHSPMNPVRYLQFIVEGEVIAYGIREDGTKYFIADKAETFIIGDYEIFMENEKDIFIEALSEVTCIVAEIQVNREKLLNDNRFLRTIIQNYYQKLDSISTMEAEPADLSERILNYMRLSCENQTIAGLEKLAFRLRCSERQLRRVLIEMEKDGVIAKCGKGKYRLT